MSTSNDEFERDPSDKINKLRAMLNERQSELKTDFNKLDDSILLKFLRSCDFEVKFSADVLINYFLFRVKNFQLFKCPRDHPGVMTILQANMFNFCSKTNAELGHGERVVYFRPGRWDESMCDPYDMLAGCVLLLEYMMLDTDVQRLGFTEIEVSGDTLAIVTKPDHLYQN